MIETHHSSNVTFTEDHFFYRQIVAYSESAQLVGGQISHRKGQTSQIQGKWCRVLEGVVGLATALSF